MVGKFIVFEGPDGSGKSAHAAMAYEWTRLWVEKNWAHHIRQPSRRPNIHLVKEPGNPNINFCRDIREMIFKKTYSTSLDAVEQGLLFFIDHYANAKFVKYMVDQGDIVIADRWLYSQYAYDPVKKNPQVDSINLYQQYETHQIRPNLVIQMDADPETIMMRLTARVGKDVSQEQKKALWGDKPDIQVHTELRQSYRNQAKRYQYAHELGGPVEWVVVGQESDHSMEYVFEQGVLPPLMNWLTKE